MRELLALSTKLREMDINPVSSMRFWNDTKRAGNVYAILLECMMHQTRASYESSEQLHTHFHQVLDMLDGNFWHHTWTAHETHFHKNFAEFCNCPFTCLTELADCVERIAMGRSA